MLLPMSEGGKIWAEAGMKTEKYLISLIPFMILSMLQKGCLIKDTDKKVEFMQEVGVQAGF